MPRRKKYTAEKTFLGRNKKIIELQMIIGTDSKKINEIFENDGAKRKDVLKAKFVEWTTEKEKAQKYQKLEWKQTWNDKIENKNTHNQQHRLN